MATTLRVLSECLSLVMRPEMRVAERNVTRMICGMPNAWDSA